MSVLRGVDGCPGGWICASLDPRTGGVTPFVYEDARALLEGSVGSITAIDIPIGLPERESRRCDVEARRMLGPRASSVFPTPMRCALEADSYKAACAASYEACGKQLSKQAFAILPRIKAVDSALRENPELRDWVYEVHPEVCFHTMNGGRPMEHPKRTGAGFMERYALISALFSGSFESIRAAIPRAKAADDDILDALAALWTAQRIGAGMAVRLPVVPEFDRYGLPMRMLS